MKKFFSYILLFLLSVLFSVPLFLSVSEKISNMDEMMNMEQKNCIDHCLSGVYLEYSSIDSIFSIFPDVVQKIFILLTSVF